MSILRDKHNGQITFECDECGGDCDTGEDDFMAALEQIKSEGWIIKKIGGDWLHFCRIECFKKKSEK